jgi:RimJ/RimL family protein N-acetyltransferase
VIVVRPATLADIEAIVAVHAAVATEARWIGTEPPVDTERFTALFRSAIEAADSHLLVALDGGRVIGNLGVHPVGGGVVGIGMSILQEYRGQGVGTALLAAAVEWARHQDGVHKVELEVWPHNAPALTLYQRHGFEVEGRRRRHYRRRSGELWDALVMGLVLDETSPGSPHPDAANGG